MRCLILATASIGALAQSPVARKEFDLVSVKPSAPDEHNSLYSGLSREAFARRVFH